MLKVERVMDVNLAQIKAGDELLSYNGIELSDEQSLKHAIWRYKGEKDAPARIRLLRGEKEGEVEVPGGSLDLIFQQPEPEPEPIPEPEPVAEPEPEPSVIEAIASWGGHADKSEQADPEPEEAPFGYHVPEAEDRYDTARGVCKFVGGFGWVATTLSVVAALISISEGAAIQGFILALAPGIAGLMTVMLAYAAMAVFDIADNSRETRRMTALMLDQRGDD